MTKARFKALLAVVVALSLFVCSAVMAFAAVIPSSGYTFTYSYVLPSFGSYSVRGLVGDSFSIVSSGSALSSSSPPLTSLSFSSSFSSSQYVNFYVGFSYFDYSFSHPVTNRLQTYKFSSVFPVSVPVEVSFRSSASSSDLLNPFIRFIPSYFDSSNRVDLPFFDVSSFVSTYDNDVYHYSFSVPFSYFSTSAASSAIQFYFPHLKSLSVSDFTLSFPSAVDPVLIDSSFNLNKDTSAAQNMVIINSINGLTQDIRQMFGPFMLQSTAYLSSLNSYFLSQSEKEENIYSNAVPDNLKQQQQQAQNQLTDYEQREQAVFDNLNTSLDGLNLNQYTDFNPSLARSFSFINTYVTRGFDGLGDFKIILFLPMVIGISLSVIGRMGSMMSRAQVSVNKQTHAIWRAQAKARGDFKRRR